MKIMFVYGAFENLGIEYLSAFLKKHGHACRLAFDPMLFNDPYLRIRSLGNFFNYENTVVRQIVDYEPDIVAFSVVSSYYWWALRIAGRVKKFLPHVHVVFGGIHPTSVPENVLANACVDSVVLGEGEYPLLELTESLQKRRLDYSIKNMWFRYEGKIIKNDIRPYIENLDELPFPDKELYYELLPYYRNGYVMITRRGCLNSCSYCHNAVWDTYYHGQKKIRMRSVADVINELKTNVQKYRFKRVRINDDLFTYNEGWLKDFASAYEKYINVPVCCYGSPATVNENVVAYLKKIQCYQISLGVQSLNPFLRKDVLRRDDDNKKIAQVITLFRKYNVRCVVDNIIGIPGETEEDLLTMARFYSEHKPHRICVYWLVYFPKTPIIEAGVKENCLTQEEANQIENDPCALANTVYNDFHSRHKIKYQWLLLLLHFFPSRLCRWIINRKLYRFFPLSNPTILEIPFTLFSKARLDIPRLRYYPQYRHFMSIVLAKKLKKLLYKRE